MKNNIKSDAGKILTLAAYPIIWAACLAYFWINFDYVDAMGYSILVLWIIIPVLTFVSSFIIGKKDYLGKLNIATPVFFGIMYMLTEYLSFSLANMVTFSKFNMPEFELTAFGALISFAGLFTGCIINKQKKSKGV